ncbi:DUF1444 family protein [Pseudomonas sp. CG7]|uniref:DUF1444 family protein n=1 Tax=unclassified Pseudomonas TaxID=196821 RepID=UPI0020342D13|nr:DUF1444 family protein [Pseudomonas sp. CG7]MCM2459116.1 DUF1444 family protein [Pseudomonas sp. CG7]
MLQSLLDKILSRPLTQEGFAKKFIESARKAGYSEAMDFQTSEFRIRHNNGSYFNLHNAFRDYQNGDKTQKVAILNGYVSTLLASGQRTGTVFENVKAHLRPVIRNLAMLEEVRLEHARNGGDKPHDVVYRSLGRDCVIMLAVDSPESTATLTRGPEAQWGVTMDEAVAISIENLRDATHEAFDEIIPGLYAAQWADGYDSSRVLLPDVLHRASVKGRPVFMIPSRDVLMVTGDKDEQGIRQMVELSFIALERGRAVSTDIYTYDGRDIVPFHPDDEGVNNRLAKLEHLLLQGSYSNQKELLDKVNLETGVDVFVASYHLYELADQNGKTVSMSAWTKGVLTLLPKTDRVALVEPVQGGEPTVKTVPWGELESELGDLLTTDAGYPPRYRTLGFPSPEQLNRLTAL